MYTKVSMIYRILITSLILLYMPGCSMLKSFRSDCLDACQQNPTLSMATLEGRKVLDRCECKYNNDVID